jgi:hypothetical protein
MHFAPIITSCFFLASPVEAQDQQVLEKNTKIQDALSHGDLMRSAAAA